MDVVVEECEEAVSHEFLLAVIIHELRAKIQSYPQEMAG
jgi:hypothetical protein